MRNIVVLALAAILFSSCVTTGLYDWGHYEDDLFDYYHEPSNKAEVVADLVRHLEKQEAKGRQPAPGLYAEAGTFYLLDGDAETAISFYLKEAEYWPESRPMMTTLIKNLEAN